MGVITTLSMATYFIMGANFITGAIVAILGTMFLVLLAVGHCEKKQNLKKYSPLPLVMAMIIIVCGNVWALFALLAQVLLSLYFVKPARLVEEMNDMS